MREYRLNEKLVKFLRSRFGEDFKCHVCFGEFEPGEMIVSRSVPRAIGTKIVWYHESCFEKCYIEA